jgi:ABC-type Fe3+-siderophore transport system permease subunit
MDIKTLRSYRLYNIAMFDVVFGIIGTVLLLLLFKEKGKSSTNYIIAGVLLTIPLGIFVHILFKVNTELNYKLGLSDKPDP